MWSPEPGISAGAHTYNINILRRLSRIRIAPIQFLAHRCFRPLFACVQANLRMPDRIDLLSNGSIPLPQRLTTLIFFVRDDIKNTIIVFGCRVHIFDVSVTTYHQLTIQCSHSWMT